MRKFWRSTSGLVAIVSLVITMATFAIGAIVLDVTNRALKQQINQRLAVETQALLAAGRTPGTAGLADRIRRREAAGIIGGHHYILTDRHRRRIAGSMDAEVPARLGYKRSLRYDGGTQIARALTTPLPDGGRLVVAIDRAAVDKTGTLIITLLAGAFGAMLLLGVAGAWTVGVITRNRLRRIDQTALAIIAGDLRQRVPVDGTDSAFDGVSMTLNRMLDRIDGLLESLRQVSSDVAHDLRTPLTRLHNRLEEVLMTLQDAEHRSAIEAAVAESRELLEIFAALLAISQIESMAVRRQFKPTRFSALVEEVLETYRPDADAGGHDLVSEIEPGIEIEGDRRLLRQLLANLLDNALHHTPPGTTIRVDLTANSESVTLTVEDDGPGVPADELPRLFQRFSRAERSRSAAGHGLGLALVSAIAAAHQGTATATSTNGFCVTVTLRKA